MSEPKILPQQFQAQSNSIASYNYTDIAEGTGIIKFYGFTTEDDAAIDYHLSTNTAYSATEGTETAGSIVSTGSFKKVIDVDFDLSEFNLPKDIEGTAIINMGHGVFSGAGSTKVQGYIKARIRKWDGSSETEIANEDSATIQAQNGANKRQIVSIKITIPKTHFKIGETLRLTIEGWHKNVTATSNTSRIPHVPQNSDTTNFTPSSEDVITKIEAYIPFRLSDIGY